ncbi:MAG TPA: NAD(P)-dependent oxidoreductase [Stellaceae bacterium]|jgi:3-hydroxyisobutyrate dehydrogenase|nr:NAD(P)-dependent oxidoreductase [Stellaceae bacterium]
MRIGFAGPGAMGGPMVLHLIEAGHQVAVLTRSRRSAEKFLDKGATWAENGRKLAAEADLVMACLPGPVEIEALMSGPDGLKAGFKPGTTYIDLATNAPGIVRRLSEELSQMGVAMLDAPISGGPKGAATRKLAIWVSGDEAVFEAQKPIFDLLGDQVRYLGPSGNASVAKLVHNCTNYGFQMVLAEAFTMGVKAGVDPVTLWSAIRQGSLGRQRTVDRMADQFLPHDFEHPTFPLELAHKDVSLATMLGREVGVPMRFSNMTLAEMTEGLAKGWGKRDSRAAMLVQEERVGLDIRVPKEVLQEILKNEPLG